MSGRLARGCVTVSRPPTEEGVTAARAATRLRIRLDEHGRLQKEAGYGASVWSAISDQVWPCLRASSTVSRNTMSAASRSSLTTALAPSTADRTSLPKTGRPSSVPMNQSVQSCVNLARSFTAFLRVDQLTTLTLGHQLFMRRSYASSGRSFSRCVRASDHPDNRVGRTPSGSRQHKERTPHCRAHVADRSRHRETRGHREPTRAPRRAGALERISVRCPSRRERPARRAAWPRPAGRVRPWSSPWRFAGVVARAPRRDVSHQPLTTNLRSPRVRRQASWHRRLIGRTADDGTHGLDQISARTHRLVVLRTQDSPCKKSESPAIWPGGPRPVRGEVALEGQARNGHP